MPHFAQQLVFGQQGESQIANWIKSRGSSVLPVYEKEINTGKGPQFYTPDGQFVAPDLFVFPAMEWTEAKHKTVFTWHRISQRWVTGIDLHHYEGYQHTQRCSGRRVWLMFLHISDTPSLIDQKHSCCPDRCPTGLFGGSLDYLAKHENHRHSNHGRHGMVYWAHDTLTLIAPLSEVEVSPCVLGAEGSQ